MDPPILILLKTHLRTVALSDVAWGITGAPSSLYQGFNPLGSISTATKTITMQDIGRVHQVTYNGNCQITLDTVATSGIPAGSKFTVIIGGAASSSVTFVAGSGASIVGSANGANGLSFGGYLQRIEVQLMSATGWWITSEAPAHKQTLVATTSFVLSLPHDGMVLRLNNAGAATVTIPEDATTTFPWGTQIEIIQINTGAVTIVPAEQFCYRALETNIN